MRERDEFVAAFYGTAPEYEVPVDYSRKSGPFARLSKDVEFERLKVEHGGPGVPGQREISPREDDLQFVPRGSVPEGEELPGQDSPGQDLPEPEAPPIPEESIPVDPGLELGGDEEQ
jgi:general secretion pathway protein D